MAPSKQARNIALVGASGNIGRPTLEAILAEGIHKVSVLVRPESTSQFPAGVTVKRGALDDKTFLVDALKGIDILILQLSVQSMGLQEGLIRAAADAGVEYVLPAEFGSDPAAKLVAQAGLIKEKRAPRRLIEDLDVSGYIAYINNPWYDFCLPMGLLGINVKARTATLWDDGQTRVNTTTMRRAGEGVAALVSLPDDELVRYRNAAFYVSSFHVNQREILASVQRATGTTDADWTITNRDTQPAIDDAGKAVAAGDRSRFMELFAALHFQKGLGGSYEAKLGHWKSLGYKQESLDEATAEIVRKIESS